MIKEALEKLVNKQDLTSVEIKEVFDEITSGLAGEINAASFISALKTKGETLDEISAAIIASKEAVSKINLTSDSENLIEITTIENPEDSLFDISLGCDLICAANGLGVYKYCDSNELFINKSYKTLESMGVSFKNLNFDDYIEKFELCNFAYVMLQNSQYFKYTRDVFRNLKIKNILNITNKMLNPANAKNQVIGVNSKAEVEKFANICLSLNNSNSIVLSGGDSFPFAALDNETFVAEAWKNKIFTYVLTPELVGLKRYDKNELMIEGIEQGADILINVISNKLKGAYFDILVLNSGLCLYIAKKADSIISGINLAEKTLESGLVFEKFEQIKKIIHKKYN